jgi:leucyl aminopeptidase (aminopeptidase T)
VVGEGILEPGQLRRYADAIVKASLGVKRGDTLLVTGEPEHRELMLAVVEAGYRAGAAISEIEYSDPWAYRSRLLAGSAEARGTISPWRLRQYRELVKPTSARAHIHGAAELGHLEGVPPKRIAESQAAVAAQVKWFQRANLDMSARWTIAGWPTDHWARQV